MSDDILAFAHIGDTHLTDARTRNFADLLLIAAQIEVECAPLLDFVALPGDVADDGTAEQYGLAAAALRMLSVPVHAIPGDHDMAAGSLDAFHRGLGRTLGDTALPKAVTVRGARCLFLDICSRGAGGPDFRLGADQLGWLARELDGARARGETSVVFTHSYPADLRGEGECAAMNRLLAAHDVALVDIGHTHYNEISNDGRTVFAATRSTGQIEEGPVGYAVTTLDRGVVGWRFRALDEGFPFVAVTSPADHRLMRGAGQAVAGRCAVRALVFGASEPVLVQCRAAGGAWVPMARGPGRRAWEAELDLPADRLVDVEVRAVDRLGRPGVHAIRAAGPGYAPPERVGDGSDADAVGAWPENGIFGTQLGPNRNGAKRS